MKITLRQVTREIVISDEYTEENHITKAKDASSGAQPIEPFSHNTVDHSCRYNQYEDTSNGFGTNSRLDDIT